MKNILLQFNKLFIALFIAGLVSSCIVTRTNVGKYTESQGTEYTFSKAKQMYLFWGLIPIGETHTETPTNGVCQVSTRFNLVDCAVIFITGGIFGMETIKVMAKK